MNYLSYLKDNIMNNLKSRIMWRMKTFSQLKREYGIKAIYRKSKEKNFSSKNTNGFPKARKDLSGEKEIDINAPVWFNSDIQHTKDYCLDEYQKCATYKYIPYDKSVINGIPLLFLDLTDTYNNDLLDKDFMQDIYDYMINIELKKKAQIRKEDGFEIVESDILQSYVDMYEFMNAYGYDDGKRDSDIRADRIFTMTLFNIINDLQICKEGKCIFMGYYHNDIFINEENAEEPTTLGDYLPSEFAIPYKICINPKYIEFCGIVDGKKEKSEITTSKRGRNMSKRGGKRIKHGRKTNKTRKKNE